MDRDAQPPPAKRRRNRAGKGATLEHAVLADPEQATEAQDSGHTGNVEKRYVLFSHISYDEESDFEAFQKWLCEQSAVRTSSPSQPGASGRRQATTPVPSYPVPFGIETKVKPFLAELGALLGDTDAPGMLVLFYARGYGTCLHSIAEDHWLSQEELVEKHADLACAQSVQSRLQALLDGGTGLKGRVRVVTALDLFSIFGRIQSDRAYHLIEWFVGMSEEKRTRYDAPKVVEAIMRVRMIGSGVPVFRLDQDVLFVLDPSNAKKPKLGLSDAIGTCLRAFRERRDEPHMATFLFSGSYDMSELADSANENKFASWGRAFATRCFPALAVVTSGPDNVRDCQDLQDAANKAMEQFDEARKLAETPPSRSNVDRMKKAKEAADAAARAARAAWERYADLSVRPEFMRRFYGLSREDAPGSKLVAKLSPEGLGWLGAHPLVSVISGALLCMNDGAILDLPPFSNYNRNVSWIDDHLKYSLHRELRHFTTVDITFGSDLIKDAKMDMVAVTKGRPPISNLAAYVLGDYLPTLLYGTVMDAWISPHPLIKWRPQNLPTDESRSEWRGLSRTGYSEGLLPSQLQRSRERARPMSPVERLEFKRRLMKRALERITEVRSAWSRLSSGGEHTFACIWVQGDVDRHLGPGRMTGKATGLVRPYTPVDRKLEVRDLNDDIVDDLRLLIDDTITYVDMTQSWGASVEQIRAIEPGTLRLDLFLRSGAAP